MICIHFPEVSNQIVIVEQFELAKHYNYICYGNFYLKIKKWKKKLLSLVRLYDRCDQCNADKSLSYIQAIKGKKRIDLNVCLKIY